MVNHILAERYLWLNGRLLERDHDKDEKDGAKTRRPVVLVCVPAFSIPFPSLFPAVFWHGNRRLTKPRGERTGMVFLGIVMTVFFWTWLLRR